MRGSVALQAALGLLWSTNSPSSLVTALAIEPSVASGAVPPEHIRVVAPEIRDESSVDDLSSEDAATAFITFEVPDDGGDAHENDEEDGVLSYTLALQITPTDTPCGPANISVASQPLSIDADGTGHATFSPSADNTVTLPFEAEWSVHCLPSADPEGEPSQLLHFDITSLSGHTLEAGLLSFVAQFRQHTPAEILSVAGSAASVTFQGAFLAAGTHADERDKSLLEDIARLEALRHRLSDIEDAIVTLEEHIASSYGVEAEALGIKGAAPAKDSQKEGENCTQFKCTVHKVVNDLSGTAKKLFDDLFGQSEEEKEDDNTTTVTRPKSGLEHPIVVSVSENQEHATPSSTASYPHHSSPAILPSGDYSMPESIMLFLPPMAMIVGIAFLLVCAHRRRRHYCKEEAQADDEETGFLARMRARMEARRRRRAAKKERAEAVKAAIRGFFRQLFCRPCPTDAEKEAERQRILEELGESARGSGSGSGGSSSSNVPASAPPLTPGFVNVDLEQAFVVGRDSEDESPYHSRRRGQPHDAESITLVGSERDEDESDSEASTTMEMDLARFREATFMVGNLVNARAGAVSAPPRRPASPTGSLPGYASDDPYPAGWGTREAEESEEESEEEDMAVADGFTYRPGAATQRPRASLDAKN